MVGSFRGVMLRSAYSRTGEAEIDSGAFEALSRSAQPFCAPPYIGGCAGGARRVTNYVSIDSGPR